MPRIDVYANAGISYFYEPGALSDAMQLAKQEALNESDDYRRPTGAVICNEEGGAVIAKASNYAGLGRGYLSRTHPKWCIRRRLVRSGKAYWLCPGCAAPSNHAEARAAGLVKGSLTDAVCYLWGHTYACNSCIKALTDVGVNRIVLSKECLDAGALV